MILGVHLLHILTNFQVTDLVDVIGPGQKIRHTE